MDFFTEYVTPAELTGYARAALEDRAENQFSLAQYLSYQTVNDLTFRFNRGGGGLVEAAQYRAFDTQPSMGRREGISRVTGELPPIGRQYFLDEYTSIRLRNADQEVRDLMLRDAERISTAIDARLELARGDALVNGSVTIAEGGVQASVDFERDPRLSTAPAVSWADHANADTIDDVEGWLQVYSDINGGLPGVTLTTRKVVRALTRSAQVRAQLYPNSPAQRLSLADVNAWLADEGMPPLATYDVQVNDPVTGLARRVIPEGRLLFLPDTAGTTGDYQNGALGATLMGITAEALQPEYEVADSQAGIVVGPFIQKETPVQVITIGAAIGIPILANPDLSMVVDTGVR
jgi:hypothetical protein